MRAVELLFEIQQREFGVKDADVVGDAITLALAGETDGCRQTHFDNSSRLMPAESQFCANGNHSGMAAPFLTHSRIFAANTA